jgi:hypothetical protein
MRSAVSLIVAVYLSSSHYNFLSNKQGVIDLAGVFKYLINRRERGEAEDVHPPPQHFGGRVFLSEWILGLVSNRLRDTRELDVEKGYRRLIFI